MSAPSEHAADTEVRVRFAPSPTGPLHIGGVRTALFNWLFARRHGGKVILRIDDTDRDRSREEYLENILASFRWLGVDFDEGPHVGGPHAPYRQSERLDLYRKALDTLVERGLAYPCYCTDEELEAERREQLAQGKAPRYSGRCRHLTPEQREAYEREGRKPAWRLKVDLDGPVVVPDLIRGNVTFDPDQIDDFILVKRDGMPTYHFASVVDDIAMGITHIIRGEEHLSNTPRHVVLFRALGAPLPKFAHVPMILAPDRTKLSKRHGATSIDDFRALGFLPEALVNYSLLLGYYPGEGREIFTPAEIAPEFSLERINKAPAVFDMEKLRWVNAHYLRNLPLDTVYNHALPFLRSAGYLPEHPTPEEVELAKRRLDAVRSRVSTLVEVVDWLSYFYRPVETYEPKGVAKHFALPTDAGQPAGNLAKAREVAARLERAAEALEPVEIWSAPYLEPAYRALIERLGIKSGDLIHPTRLALTGRTVGPGLFDVMELLGKETTIERLRRAAQWIRDRVAQLEADFGETQDSLGL
ncbi:glutamate--tRNA ligase [Brockia lithotrophica]|uniref:Glutamate--tRNA ligase n=1 Tax=Brockia lithotrophica TaxID=933949 RepID=A0A660KUH1_9BACL|nr:glutamate--tRNA ligase [Brockia lithotrophica]RKQ83518.1 glutamyl-tRNA synthetase [Brockia lithotrophica]